MKAGTINRLQISIMLFFLLLSCEEEKYTSLSGKTMGTYYSIQYKSGNHFGREIDSILLDFVTAASTYDSTSEISEFNRNGGLQYRSPHLFSMLTIAKTIHHETKGAFEPTLMPVISAYGFAGTKDNVPSKIKADSLLSVVSFDYVSFDSVKMIALKRGVQLDLSAMGEGFAIELIAGFLEANNIWDYKVEIGGEMKCKGKNPGNERWLIGIEAPSVPDRQILGFVRLQDEAISTSGSYRKFYTDRQGKKQSHIIDPTTGSPVQNNLLSVTIKSKSAIKADAYATACMVMGYSKAIAFIGQSNVEGLITYEENGKVRSWHSRNFFDSYQGRITVRL
jgi:FAD:protein FMN transferase